MKKFPIFFILIFVISFFSFVFFSASLFASEVPNIVFNFQQPSYVTDKNPELSEFTCDITKPDCKVNFDLSPSFTGSFVVSDFLCSLDFGMGAPTGEESKCNPNTVIFTGSYDYIVRFQIVSKADSTFFSERTLTIHSGYTPSDSETSTGTLSDSGTLADSGSSLPEEIFVSSGSISLITHNSAVLSGVVLKPETLTGIVYYGTGELSLSGAISLGTFSFA